MTPGVYDGIDEATYFADRALSFSGAKRLLSPSCPAIYKYERDNGRPNKTAFDIGHMVHQQVLGTGAPLQLVEAADWRTKKAQEQRDAAYASGAVPLLSKEWDAVRSMAAAVRAHPIAGPLFDPATGKPETSLFWHDERYGIDKRARLDWLRPTLGGRAITVDLKTTPSVEPGAIARSVATFFYDQQADWYSEAVRATGLAEDVAFLFVFVAKDAPHLITVCELDAEAMHRGRLRNDRASEVYAECLATDTWPSFTSDIELIRLPKWATYSEDVA